MPARAWMVKGVIVWPDVVDSHEDLLKQLGAQYFAENKPFILNEAHEKAAVEDTARRFRAYGWAVYAPWEVEEQKRYTRTGLLLCGPAPEEQTEEWI